MKHLIRSFVLIVPLLAFSPLAAASPDQNLDARGVAIHGYDPVAYFTQKKAVKGSPRYSHKVGDATYYFSSAKHRDLFAKAPSKYAPQFGGFCALGASMGRKFDVDPQAWRIVNGKLYFNLNKQVQKTWLSDVPGHLKKAEAKWKDIKDTPADQLK